MASRNPERQRQWQSLLTKWHQSDQTIAAFCKQRNLGKPTFGYWQRKIGFGRRSKPRYPAAVFVPITLVTEAFVEMTLLGGMVLKVPLSASAEQIARWLTAARTAT